MTFRTRLRPYVISTLVLSSAATLPAATLRLLPVPDTDLFGYGLALSDGGSVTGYLAGPESTSPYLWAKTTTGYGTPLPLPLLPGGVGGAAHGISADGAFATGYIAIPATDFELPLNHAPVLWTRGGLGSYTVTALPRLAGSPAEGFVAAASANGSRLAGNDGATATATVWRGSPGSGYFAQALPLPAGTSQPSFATAASADGARLAGHVTTGAAAHRAVIWSETNGAYSALALQTPAGASQSFAETISPDGTLVAGTSEIAGLHTATKWDARTGQATLLEARPDADTTALSISTDKNWIGGHAIHRGDLAQTAVLWSGQGKVFTLTSLAADVNFGSFVPGDVSTITLVSPGVYTVLGTGTTLGTGQTQAYVIENLALPDTATPPPATTPTTTPTEPTAPTEPPATSAPTTPPPATDLASSMPNFDPAAPDSRVLMGDAFAAIFDATRAIQWRFTTDQAALRPLRATFPGTNRDALVFDGRRMLPGPRAQDLFTPGVAQDLGFVGVVGIPASGGGGRAILLSINHSPAEPALALGYDYAQGRFYAVYLQAFNGAPSEIAGPASPRGASYVVRLQKTGGVVSLRVNGALMAETNSARPVLLNPGQGAPIGLGGIRSLNPQFVGHLGRFHLRNTALNAADAAALETDLRNNWLTGGTPTTPTTPSTPTTPTTEPPSPPPPTNTTPPADTTTPSDFDPASPGSATIVNNTYAALLDPARGAWRFATDQASIRPLRVAFPGTTRDSLGFDGARILPGPRSSDLFTPGVSQDLGLVAAVRIPASGGGGRATILTVNRSDTEPAIGIGYDYTTNRFFAHYTQGFNGAPAILSDASSPRGANYVVRLQKSGATVRLHVNGVLVAETTTARPAILASGQNGHLGLGGIRALNPQFVGQVGKFHLRNAALSDSDAAKLEAEIRAWFTP